MGVCIQELHELRRARGLTQAQLGRQAGLSLTTISLLERGHPIATIRTLHQLAPALGLPVEELLRCVTVVREDAPTGAV
jgi:transcriptional regulator with XRE-family HTH domain